MSETLEKLKLTDEVRRSEDSIWRQVGDQVVLLVPEEGTYHWLDEIGTKIWLLLEQDTTVAQIASAIFKDYEAKLEVIEADTVFFIEKLIDFKIVNINVS